MGRNVNLCWMLGLKNEVVCPKCGQTFKSYLDDYDIDDGHTNPEPGVWVIGLGCPHCEHEWKARFIVTPQEPHV